MYYLVNKLSYMSNNWTWNLVKNLIDVPKFVAEFHR